MEKLIQELEALCKTNEGSTLSGENTDMVSINNVREIINRAKSRLNATESVADKGGDVVISDGDYLGKKGQLIFRPDRPKAGDKAALPDVDDMQDFEDRISPPIEDIGD